MLNYSVAELRILYTIRCRQTYHSYSWFFFASIAFVLWLRLRK